MTPALSAATTDVVFDEKIWWYVARSGGVLALVMVVASIVWGLLLSSRYLAGGPKPKGLLDLHRFLGGLSVVFTVIHVVGLYLDSYIEFTVLELLVPFVDDWRPAEVAAGVIAAWLLLAVQATSLLMKRLPRRLWKWIHLSSYGLLLLGVIHGITAGTDASTWWYRGASAGAIGLVVWLTAWRAIMVPARGRRRAELTPANAGRT